MPEEVFVVGAAIAMIVTLIVVTVLNARKKGS